MPDPQQQSNLVEFDPQSVPPPSRFHGAYNRLASEYQQKFGKPLTVTGDSRNNPMHNRPSLGGQATDVRNKDISPDEDAWLGQRSQELGLHTIKATGKESWATGPHRHIDKGNAEGTGDFVEFDPSNVSASSPVPASVGKKPFAWNAGESPVRSAPHFTPAASAQQAMSADDGRLTPATPAYSPDAGPLGKDFAGTIRTPPKTIQAARQRAPLRMTLPGQSNEELAALRVATDTGKAQREESRREAANQAISQRLGIPLPRIVTEALADIGGAATTSVGENISGIAKGGVTRPLQSVLRMIPGAGEAMDTVADRVGKPLQEMGQQASSVAGRPEGIGKDISREAGKLPLLLLARNPGMVAAVVQNEALGRGESEAQATKEGVITGASVAAMGGAAGLIGHAVPESGIVPALTRFGMRAATNTAIPLAADVPVALAEGRDPIPDTRAKVNAAVMGAGFAALPHGTPAENIEQGTRSVAQASEQPTLEAKPADLPGSGKTIVEELPHHSNYQPRSDDGTFVEGKLEIPATIERGGDVNAIYRNVGSNQGIPVQEVGTGRAIGRSGNGDSGNETRPDEDTPKQVLSTRPGAAISDTATPDRAAAAPPIAAESTGLKKSVVNAERAARQADPIDDEGTRHWGPLWDKVKREVASGARDSLLLAKELNKTKRPVTDEEVATLLHGKRRTTDQHREAMTAVEDAIAKGDEVGETAARVRAGLIEADRDTIEQATRGAVRENARGLSMMRGMVKDDYLLVNMIQRAKVARGEELPADVRTKLETLSKQLQEKDAALEKQGKELADLQAKKSIQRTIDEEKRSGRRQTRANTKEALDKEWGDLQANFDTWAKKAVSTTHAGIDPEGVKIIAKMARNRIRSGVNTAEGLVDDIYNKLKDRIDGLEKRDVRDAISGYGVTAEPTKNDLTAQLGELKRQMRVVSAIEDVQAGQRPAKTGFQRAPESEKVKGLRMQLDDVMKAQGMRREMTPEQKAAIVQKNLESDISDLDRRIKEKDFSSSPRGPKVTSPEIEDLRARRAELQSQYDELKPEGAKRQMTPEQKINMVQRSLEKRIDELNQRLKEGDYSKPQRGPKVLSPEINRLRGERDKLQAQFDELRPEEEKRQMTDEQRLKAVKTRLQSQIVDYQKRLDTGDYSKPTPRSPVAYDPEAKRLEADRNRLRQQVENEVEKQKQQNRSGAQKTADFIVKAHQEIVLSSTNVFTKLGSAALGRIITQPMEQGINSVWGKVMPSVARRAPIEGGGSWVVEGEALKRTFSRETAKEMRNELPVIPGENRLSQWANKKMGGKGGTDLAALHDEKASTTPEEIRLMGHFHGALKVPAKINTFYRALGKQTEYYTRQQIENGASPEEAQAYVQRPEIQALMTGKAYEFAQRNILMGDNSWSMGFSSLMRMAHNAGEEGSAVRLGGRSVEFIGRFLFPVTKVAPNFVNEVFSYSPIGAAKAAVQGRSLIKAKLQGAEAFQKALSNLKPEDADYIMRNMSKATLGTAMMALGFGLRDNIGGYYNQEDAKDKSKNAPDFGGMTIHGWKVPRVFLHTPLLESLQIGATIGHIYDKARASRHGVAASFAIGVGEGGVESLKGLAEEIPFFGSPKRMIEDEKREGLTRTLVKPFTTGFIPPDVQRASRTGIPLTGGKLGDLDRRGEVVKRAPRTSWEDVKNITPVLRRSVPQR